MDRTLFRLSSSTILLMALCLSPQALAAEPRPVSIVDYMKASGSDSSFANRKEIYSEQWPAEAYAGTAEQNLKLLKFLLDAARQLRIPSPSSDIANCRAFYEHPDVAKYLTKAFMGNAIDACIVTGTKTPQNMIRRELQKAYSTATPANGMTFTYEEHKAIHDKAYKAAGCQEDSARLILWMAVDTIPLYRTLVDIGISTLGQCTVIEEK